MTGQASAGEVGGLRAGRRLPTPEQQIDRVRAAVLDGDWPLTASWLGARYSYTDSRGALHWPRAMVLARGLELFEFEQSTTMAMLAVVVCHKAGTFSALRFLGLCWQDKQRWGMRHGKR